MFFLTEKTRSACGTSATLNRYNWISALWLLSDASAKVFDPTEDAHSKSHEHLHEREHLPALTISGGLNHSLATATI